METTLNIEALRRFNRLGELTTPQLEALSSELEIFNANKGAVLMDVGNTDDVTMYLLDGEIRQVAIDGREKFVKHTDVAARHPISCLRPSHYRVTAASPVRYLMINNSLLVDAIGYQEPFSSLRNYEVSEEDAFDDQNRTGQLLLKIYEDLNRNRLVIPSLQDIAENISRAILAEQRTEQEAAQLIMQDPVLAIKIIHASAAYTSVENPALTVAEAVNQLGLEKTQHLVVRYLFQETLRADSEALNWRMRQWWEKSIQLSAASRAIAGVCERFDPEYSAIAGLLHGIGEAVVLNYSAECPGLAESPELLEQAVAEYANEVGRGILGMWNLPQEFINTSTEPDGWLRKDSKSDYADIVLIAQFFLARKEAGENDLPDIEQLPAYHKLGLDKASTSFNTSVEQQISNAIDHAATLWAS